MSFGAWFSLIALVLMTAFVVLGWIHFMFKVRAGRRAFQLPRERVVVAASSRVRDLVLWAIARMKGRDITEVDGVISFRTGMSLLSWEGQALEVQITDRGDGTCEVHVIAYPNPTSQIWDSHESDILAQRLLDLVQGQLGQRT